MKSINEYDNRVWNAFFDFVFPDDRDLTRAQVQTELRNSGVDMRPALKKLQGILRMAHEAETGREALEAAAESRASVMEKLARFKAPEGPSIREKLRSMIADRLQGSMQAVYARKLEDAASDEDLKSLLEDIARLDALAEDGEDGET